MKVSADVCPLCEGTGWKAVSIGSDRRVTRCDCRLQARTQTLLAAARIPKRYEHCELSNFEFDGPHRPLASPLAWPLASSWKNIRWTAPACC